MSKRSSLFAVLVFAVLIISDANNEGKLLFVAKTSLIWTQNASFGFRN